MWIRGSGAYDVTEHQNYHRIALAYASDMVMAGLVLNLYPNFVAGLKTSLDHSMWFHESVDSKRWYLYCSELEHSVNGKMLNAQR